MTIAITYAPNFAKRILGEEIKNNKDDNFILLYQQGDGDSTGDKIYRIGLYKMVGYAPIRQEGNLADVLDFIASKYKNVQIINTDTYEEKGAK